MKLPTNFTAFGPILRTFMWRHSLTIFLVPTIGAVAIAILIMYQVVQSASAPVSSDAANTITFDQDTMDKLKKLKPATSLDTYSLPANQRSNPFTE